MPCSRAIDIPPRFALPSPEYSYRLCRTPSQAVPGQIPSHAVWIEDTSDRADDLVSKCGPKHRLRQQTRIPSSTLPGLSASSDPSRIVANPLHLFEGPPWTWFSRNWSGQPRYLPDESNQCQSNERGAFQSTSSTKVRQFDARPGTYHVADTTQVVVLF